MGAVTLEKNAATPLVSIILPTHNRADFLASAIRSVVVQTFADFEMIVIDDGSTDTTEQVVQAFADPRLVYVKQDNKGRSNARNHGLRLARGMYIAFLDSDDMYLPTKLARQIAYMEAHPETGMVYTSAHCIDAQGLPLDRYYEATVSGHIYEEIAFFSPVTITLPTVMVRSALMLETGDFDEAMDRFEDTDMWRRIAKRTTIHAMPVATCNLRTHQENALSAQDPRKIMAALDYYAHKIRREDTAMGRLVLRKGLGRLYGHYAVAFLNTHGCRWYGFHLMLLSIIHWPFYAVRYAFRKLGAFF